MVIIPDGLAGLLAGAYAGGAETTFSDLARLLEIDEASPLDALTQLLDFLEGMNLRVDPGVDVGDFASVRVVRSLASGDANLDRVRLIASQGESANVEFKSSLLASMKDWEASGALVEHPALSGEVLKTVCAFLNTEGGSLLVGVNDEGNLSSGIEVDRKLKNWTLDKWILHLTGLIVGRFHEGKAVASYVQTSVVNDGGSSVALVSVTPRAARSFVQRGGGSYEYFVRNGARSDSLDLIAFDAHLSLRLLG